MPTPVSTARQCLTEETARALDDAVAVARRRSHAQTTSLHAISGLLTMPSSILREVCISRAAHSTPYSSRLQFRALELCVGVSLDRLPSSKPPPTTAENEAEEEPPVSNSLMAAIKRSQATQRRHPETYHLHQLHGGVTQTTSVLKVELKYFILSILDDPIVSRVFGEAGFRSTEIKLDVLHPPVTRFPRSRCPPLFLCNVTESGSGRARFGYSGDFDENCRRIGEVLGRKDKKNPLLVGTCGGKALKTFSGSINRGKVGFLPLEISGLSVVSVEKEIGEMKLDQLGRIVEQSCLKSKTGTVLNLGELKVLTSDALVSRLSELLKLHCEKLWFVGSVSSNEMYLKLIERFPTIDKDWNLHLLPITSSNQGVYPKSSLMGSFVPFGGFFSSTSDFRVPFSNSMNQSRLPRCHLCNEKCEQEVTALGKSGEQCSEKLPCWLRNVESEQDKGIPRQAKDDPNTLASVQKKWDDICQRIHQTPAFPKLSFQPVRPQFPLQLVSTLQTENPPHQPGLSVKISKPKHTEDQTTRTTTNSPLSCVTTDLGLGTIYQESSPPVSLNRRGFELIKEKPLSRYCKDFKSLRELLSRKVGFQNEAVNAVSEIICGYRDDRSHLASATSNVWLALLGPDQVGKKKVATALAEAFFGGGENCVCVDFKAQDGLDDRFRGKTVVDYIAGEVSKRVESVVFIENVDKAEFPDQVRLSDAVRTGKLRDSHGREISMKNVMVLATTSGFDNKDSDRHALDNEHVKYSEGRVLSAKNWKIQIKLADNANKNCLNKRRQELGTEATELRAVKSQRSFLDLNLPVDETEANADEEAHAMSENSKSWLEDFFEQVDGKVTFKTIGFDGLAKNIQRSILSHFHRSFGHETRLEIESDAILQILAALRWSPDEEKTVDQWMQTVLSSSFAEARQKYNSNSSFAVKLVASEDSTAEEETTGIQLPARVEVI
ncbi:hypothetical protein HID58_059626 [Brassica napus]|uniref:Clp R domain-containing protein n=1 Tax=Brassica napus TaxID=3708 RepID=A0ABQ7ZTG4_BRANA|nr:protein SMAX1-LIKE 7 [Brassica napus]KAH0883530.1 hypothetical protein HID58_059626 [Brassica napus]